VTLDQFVADFHVIWQWSAWTQLPEPLLGNRIWKSPKAEYRNVNGESFARAQVFDKITPASRTLMMNEWFTRVDFEPAPLRTSRLRKKSG
jgi:hypothetical protein